MEDGAPTLYTTDDTGSYVEYTPPETPSFNEALPEDLRESEHLKDVEDGTQLARYYVDLKSNYLKPPDTADGYEFSPPDGYDLNANNFNEFKNLAFESGVNQKQFEEVMKFDAKRQAAALESVEKNILENRAEAEKSLKAEWGDNYEKKMESAKTFLKNEKVADENFMKFLEDSKFGDNPQVIRMFAKLADLISEDGFVKPGSGDEKAGPLTDEAGRPMLSFPSMEE